MRIEGKVDILDQVTSFIWEIIFYFKVALADPVALFIFCLILITGLITGVKQVFFHKKRKPLSKIEKKNLVIVLFLIVIIGGLFYFV